MNDQAAGCGRLLLEAVEDFQRAGDVQDLWKRLNDRLTVFGITGLIYGTEAMPDPHRFLGLMLNSVQGDWLNDKFSLDLFYCDEYVEAARCGETAPILWSDTSRLATASDRALQSLAVDYDHGIITGVSIPMRFAGGLGASSIGCHADNMSFAEFDRIWAVESGVIAGIVNAFDVRLRADFKAEIFPLDAREKECLKRMAAGQRVQRIADAMSLTDRQVEKVTISARRKLHATTLPQAIATALIFELIAL
ncbi:helix-turn-helix transcriptional regulator [Azospirillum argentinense]